MIGQAELLQFFEMMLDRAKQGEFRFCIVGTVDVDGVMRTTIAGMATETEADDLLENIESQLDSDTQQEMRPI